MAAHRYWRIAGLQAGANGLELAEVQLRDAGGTNRIGTGTATASSVNTPGTTDAPKAVDGSTATEWVGIGGEYRNAWWQYDFGAGNAWDIASVIISSGAGYTGTPTQFGLVYSDDGSTWTDACAALNASTWTASGQSQTITVTAAIGTAWNTLDTKASTLSSNNLVVTSYTGASSNMGARSLFRSTGKYYFEGTYTTATSGDSGFGIANASALFNQLGSNALNGFMTYQGFTPYFNGAAVSFGTFGACPQGTTVGIAIDLSNTLLWVRQSAAGQWNGSGTADPVAGTGGFNYSAIGSSVAPVGVPFNVGDAFTLNVGNSAFVGTRPSGFSSWGLPAPATTMQATQLAVEEWALMIPPQMQATQLAIEQWALVTSMNTQMSVTQIALEQWATVSVATTQARVMILA